MHLTRRSLLAAGIALAAVRPLSAQSGPNEMLNVSYDIGRELYAAINEAFVPYWQGKTGQAVTVDQSHGGTSKQARAILEGLQADVVTFNQVTDIQALVKGGFVTADWQQRLPYNASPYYSLPAFLVRKGNPKGIEDWDDLVRDDIEVVFPNPKTSGNARYTYLAAYAYALKSSDGDQVKAEEFVKTLFAHVPVFDAGGRAATTTFVERGIGDVLITFEAEVNAIRREFGDDEYDIVVPSQSILAEFPVAVVDKVADQRGSRSLATGYLEFLYTPEAQDIIAQFSNRVRDPAVAARYADRFPQVSLVTVEEVFGGWDEVQKVHFAEGGILDRVFTQR